MTPPPPVPNKLSPYHRLYPSSLYYIPLSYHFIAGGLYTLNSFTYFTPTPLPSPLTTTLLLSVSMYLFLFCFIYVSQIPHISEIICLCLIYCVRARSCLTLCDPMDYSPLVSSVHGVFQARILKWGAISFSRGSSRPRD